MDSLLTITAGRYVAGVCPQPGGALAYFGLAGDSGIEFVRPASARVFAEHNVRLTSCYPLVPYSNRIGDGRFGFGGVDHLLQPNSSLSPHPLHGVGWLHDWVVSAAAPERIELAFTHARRGPDDPDWPWSFGATQTITLDAEGLRIALTLTNYDDRPMPAGIGLHPFFPKSPRMEARFACAAVWQNDARMLPKERVAVPDAWDYAQLRPVADLTVDNCFAGWSREAELRWPERGWGLRIAGSEVFGHLVVFTSPARDAIAIEPVSHANNAVNLAATRGDTGLAVLAPGAMLTGTMTLTPFRLDDDPHA